MHKVFDEVAAAVDLPLINLIDETARYAKELGLKTLGLLGTRYTMSDGFYQDRLSEFGLETIVPSPEDQETIHRVIVEELIRGDLSEKSRNDYTKTINDLVSQGAQGIILGCTEIPLLVQQKDVHVPLLDTAVIHAEAALNFSIGSTDQADTT